MWDIGWWVLALGAGLVAALSAIFLGRQNTPKWLSAPLFFSATILAGVGAFQSVLDLRAGQHGAETDCARAQALDSEELKALSLLVRNGRADAKLQRDFACAFAAAVAPAKLSRDSRQALVDAAAELSGEAQDQKRAALLALQDASTRGDGLDTLLQLAKNAEDYKRIGALAAAAETERALAAYNAALRLAPSDLAARAELGALLYQQGDYAAAEQAFRVIVNSAGAEPEWRASASFSLGQIALRVKNPSGAQQLFEQALESYERASDRAGAAKTLSQLGALAASRRQYEAAAGYFSQAVQASEQLGRKETIAQALSEQAAFQGQQGERQAAEDGYKRALTLYQRAGDKAGVAAASMQLGRLALAGGEERSAEKQFERAVELYQAQGRREEAANAMIGLGQTHLARKRPKEAEARFYEALSLHRALGREAGQADALIGLGRALLAQNQVAESERRLNDALAVNAKLGRSAELAQTRVELGRAAAKRRDVATAKAQFRQAVSLYEATGAATSPEALAARRELERLGAS